MTRKTQKHGYEAPEIKFLELDQTGGGLLYFSGYNKRSQGALWL